MIKSEEVSQEVREEIIREFKDGVTINELSTKYNVPVAVIEEWIRQDKIDEYYIPFVTHTSIEGKKQAIKTAGIAAALTNFSPKLKGLLGAELACMFLCITITLSPSITGKMEPTAKGEVELQLDSLIAIQNSIKGELKNNLEQTNSLYDSIVTKITSIKTTTNIYNYINCDKKPKVKPKVKGKGRPKLKPRKRRKRSFPCPPCDCTPLIVNNDSALKQ